jgi:hypothetical protein
MALRKQKIYEFLKPLERNRSRIFWVPGSNYIKARKAARKAHGDHVHFLGTVKLKEFWPAQPDAHTINPNKHRCRLRNYSAIG